VEPTSQPIAARGDLLLLAGATMAFALLSIHFEFAEQLLAWTRPRERYQIDELPVVLLFLACGLAWYSWRRVAEARAEITLRRMTERQLRDALAENRDLALAAVRMQEQERRSLARELHDELGQYLNAAKIDAVALRDGGAAGDPVADAGAIVASLDHVECVVRHIVRRLRPPGLDELGLPAALEDCIEGWRRRLPAVEFRLQLADGLESLDEATNITLYRLVQEGLTNVAKHAQAKRVEIALTRSGAAEPAVVLTMRDDGVGRVPGAGRRGLGLIGMRERVEALAGSFEIASPELPGFAFVARLPMTTVAVA
jgi:signal transduction histidine kinase